jgi:hypothetical protein
VSPKKSAIRKLVEGLSPAERQEVLDLAAQLVLDGPSQSIWDRIIEIRERAERSAAIRANEPANGRIVKFGHRFHVGGKVYTYTAIRADNPRGDRRWFISGSDDLQGAGHRGIVSPATWVELIEFAIPHTVMVAPLNAHWQFVGNPAPRRASTRMERQIDDAFFGPTGDVADIY